MGNAKQALAVIINKLGDIEEVPSLDMICLVFEVLSIKKCICFAGSGFCEYAT